MASASVDALAASLETADIASFINNNLPTILDDLRFLSAFLEDPPQKFVENGKSADLESMASEATSIVSSVVGLREKLKQTKKEGKVIYDEIKQLPRSNFPMTEQVDFIDYVVENLREHLKNKPASTALLKHQIATVADLLLLLKARCVTDIEEPDEEEDIEELRSKNQELKDLRIRIMQVVYEVEYVTDSFLSRDGPTWCHKFWLSDILQELRSIVKQATVEVYDKEVIVGRLISETGRLEVVSILNVPAASKTAPPEEIYNDPWVIRKFDIRLRCVISQPYKKKQREVLRDIFNLMKAREAYKPSGDEREMSNSELAAKLCQSLSGWKCLIILEDIWDIEALDAMKRLLQNGSSGCRVVFTTRFAEVAFSFPFTYVVKMDLTNRFQLLIPGDLQVAESSDSSQSTHPNMDEAVVGFRTETSALMDRLVGEPKYLEVIPIVGMQGIGKTTLAKKSYDDPSVENYFDVRAWCFVSETYERRELLLQILDFVLEGSGHHDETDDECLARTLYASLKGVRYLIVLDNMWNLEAWDCLRNSFPNDRNGSRILLTTTLFEVARQVEHRSEPIFVRLLSDDECWELLTRKLFSSGSCPTELLDVGKEIARNCKGLPLLVVWAARRLAMMEKTVDWWKKVEEIRKSLVFDHVDVMRMSVIGSSYKQLPDHLKPCFLYFAGFPEDKAIPVQKLIRFWIGEGFVRHTNSESLEEVAENYLMDLIGRNLVMVVEENAEGRAKACRLHSLFHEFCVEKAKQANLWQQIDECDPVPDEYTSDPTCDRRWLRVCTKRKDFIMSKPSGPRVRSLLFFASTDDYPSYPYDVSFIFENFKLLRILDFEDINIGDSFKGIELLIHLRYLAVQCDGDSIPSSIANLCNLETFLVQGLRGEVTVPDFIWDMARLRHLHIRNHACFSLHNHIFEISSQPENLRTLSTPSLSYGDDMEKILRRLPRLRKLGCIFLDSWDDSRNCNRFPLLDFLTQLESLKVFYRGAGKYPCKFHFPSNLRKLTLSNFCMPWNELSKLAILVPNLEVLKLQNRAFVGERWEVGDECFPKLRMLKLDTLDIEDWYAYADSFPCLERLVVHRCKQLEEIPPSLGDIPTLQMIEVKWCSHSAAASARQIHEEQLEFGNEGFRVAILDDEWNL